MRVDIMHRFIVTRSEKNEAIFSSIKENDALDYMYGTSDLNGSKHMKLWDLRQSDGDNPKMIEEINNS